MKMKIGNDLFIHRGSCSDTIEEILTDSVIDAAQSLLKNAYLEIGGLQAT